MPHQESEKSSAELMFGRNLNSRLNLMFPRTELKVKNDKISIPNVRNFKEGERVAVFE